jgi:hypothetical protein
MKPKRLTRYLEDVQDGMRSGRLALASPDAIRKEMAGAREETVRSFLAFSRIVEPAIAPALEAATVIGWPEETWQLMRDSVPACVGTQVDTESFLLPQLWVIPPRSDHEVAVTTGILWVPAIMAGRSAVHSVLLVAPAETPWRPVSILAAGGIAHGETIRGKPLDVWGGSMETEDSMAALFSAGTAFMRSKVARNVTTERRKKGARRRSGDRPVTVAYLRRFEDQQGRATIAGRKAPRAHWVGLPYGFLRRAPNGRPGTKWIEPFVRGVGKVEPEALRRRRRQIAVVSR